MMVVATLDLRTNADDAHMEQLKDVNVVQPVVSRITAAGNLGLDRFEGSGVLEAGLINLVALDAIVERLGARWQGRREAIYDMTERVLSRAIGEEGYFVRVSETDFLVAQPDCGAFAGQARCLRALSEILKHFLGTASHHDLRVRQVLSIYGGEITAAIVDPVEAMHASEANTPSALRGAGLPSLEAPPTIAPALLSPERWSPFLASNGHRIRVSCVLEPVFELKNNRRIGFRLNSRVIDVESGEALSHEHGETLSRSDLVRIDMATISRGLARLSSNGDLGSELSLIIPVSYITLTHQQGRTVLAEALHHARVAVKKGIICEVRHIEHVPQVALLTAVSLIKPWVLFTVGFLGSRAPISTCNMKDAGLQAVAFSCPHPIAGDAEFLGWLRSAISTARRSARTIMVYGCSPRQMALASVVGATHASVAATPSQDAGG